MTPGSRWLPRLLVLGSAAIALTVRVVAFHRHSPLLFGGSDNAWYHEVAHSLATGDWGRLPAVDGGVSWSVMFPPAYPTVLGVGETLLFWVEPTSAQLWTSAALGALAAGLVAALAWRLTATAATGLRITAAVVAGLLLACNPLLVGTSVSLMSEALLLPLVAAVLLVCDRLLQVDSSRVDGGRGRGRRVDVVLLGLLVALGALARGEALVTLGAPVVAAAVVARRRAEAPRSTRPWLVALAIGVTAVVTWSALVSFGAERPLLVSTNSGSLLLGANCARAHTTDHLGYWTGTCPDVELGLDPGTADALAAQGAAFEADPFRLPPGVGLEREAEIGARQTRAALDEITGDPLAFAGAVPVRLARGLGVYWTDAQTFQEGLEGRDTAWEQRGRWFHLVLVLPATLLALVALAWRRSAAGAALRSVTDVGRIAPMLALVGTWAVVVMATYGSARLRTTIEPALAVLAALGVVTAIRWWSARRAQPGRSSLAS